MMKHLALLRGINVGGNARVPMAELRVCFESLGYEDVSTYINSGNVIFTAKDDDLKLREKIESCLLEQFGFTVPVVVIKASNYQKILSAAPEWWGKDPAWRHNLIFMLEPYDMDKAVEEIGELKPNIEYMQVGEGFIFQSNLMEAATKTRFSRITGTAVYKQMTIRNYNTAQKLAQLLK